MGYDYPDGRPPSIEGVPCSRRRRGLPHRGHKPHLEVIQDAFEKAALLLRAVSVGLLPEHQQYVDSRLGLGEVAARFIGLRIGGEAQAHESGTREHHEETPEITPARSGTSCLSAVATGRTGGRPRRGFYAVTSVRHLEALFVTHCRTVRPAWAGGEHAGSAPSSGYGACV